MLTRIYGTAFTTKKELDDYLKMLDDAEKNNHRVLGEQLEIFAHFDLVGKGLPVWLPNGETIIREIEKFATDTENNHGYLRVATPHIAKKELFVKSGHLPYYEESMFPKMKLDDGEYYLKSMNCPLHHLIYLHKLKSYRDLPVRLAEYGMVYRKELSGTLTGLQRVRGMRMNDAHIYCRKDQIEEEIRKLIVMINEYYKVFGLKDFWFRLSLGDLSNKNKYINEPENWKHTEEILREVLSKLKVKFKEVKNEAAFYGPKIDIEYRNVYGKEDTLSTIQLDFAAKKRFNLFYFDADGRKNNDVFVIHRAPLSTHERLVALLIEHYRGKFPVWLSPVHVIIMTIADRHVDHAKKFVEEMKSECVRAEIDDRTESIGKKVRDSQAMHIPYLITIGDKEIKENNLSVRTRDNKVITMRKDEFIKRIKEEIKNRTN